MLSAAFQSLQRPEAMTSEITTTGFSSGLLPWFRSFPAWRTCPKPSQRGDFFIENFSNS